MPSSSVRFTCFPLTEKPPAFIGGIVDVFRAHEEVIGTVSLTKGLTSNEVLGSLRTDLKELGFQIEKGKMKADRVERPVFFGEDGHPELNYQIDAFHPEWKCGLEVEAGRAWMGNAVYRDLIQALVMVDVDHLVLAVPNRYKYKAVGKATTSTDYDNTISVAKALYGHTRVRFPYQLTVLGY
jgi:hypothetical protein